jgi:antitoxin HicB
MDYKLPLILEPQPEGGYTVTSPALPELITEGDSVDEALENARDAFAAVCELYHDLGKSLPPDLAVAQGSWRDGVTWRDGETGRDGVKLCFWFFPSAAGGRGLRPPARRRVG